MRPCFKHRRVVEVLAGKAWESTLKHRVYSCPDAYGHVSGATGLILLNRKTGARVPLEVHYVASLVPDDHSQVDALTESLRRRAQDYLTEARQVSGIIEPGKPYRFYFLGEEPWPDWLQELTAAASDTEWAAILSICCDPKCFFEWPQVGELLWPGCTRMNGDQQHNYPSELVARLNRLGFELDTRSNGPAIIAFLAAGGKRPTWCNEGWPIHHLYDGTEPPRTSTGTVPHAAQDGRYFTHSAGLVAAHPVAHHLAHQSALLKWLLRREAFLRFRFDPMGVFVSQ